MSETVSRAEGVLDLTEQLLKIESVITEERVICDWLEQRFAAWSPHALIRASNSLCVVPREPDPSLPTVMLVGHVDTVPKLSENPVRREGDKLYGLGASDMKAADAVLIDAVERAKSEAPKRNLVGLLYAREEGPYDDSEMPLIAEAAKPWFDATDFAVCMEPTDGRIELGCLGTSHAQVTFGGQRAHSARPWQGDNAIHKAGPLLQRLSAWGRRRFTFEGLEFSEVMNATTLAFRGARNVIPDELVVNINYRFAPGKERADVEAELDAVVAGDGAWEIVDFCPAGRVCATNPLLGELRTAAGDPETCAKQAWTDVGRLSHMGIDAINWGPGATSQAHQAGEWVDMREVARSVEVVSRWLW